MAKYLITVVGPTAIGKTALSIKLANHFQCEIVSCDSRQFYREMSIGTAVPDESELVAAKHHFIHNKSIFDSYSVGDFEKDAIETLDTLYKTNDFAILVGGSGLYVDAVLKGFDDFPEVDSDIRETLQQQFQENGITYLQNELQRLDPDYYEAVDKGNPQRMMRALEVSLSSGKPYSSFLNNKKNIRNFIPIIVGLDADRELMYDRINRRVDIMIENGLIEEAQSLYPHRELNALQTVGYRELFTYFSGETDLETAISEIKKNTRRFAKRQMTWFKRLPNVRWFDFTTDIDSVVDYIRRSM